MVIQIDQIIHSRRKSIALIIRADGRLVVRAPLRASDERIRSLVEQKAGWIRTKQAQARQARPAMLPKRYAVGENFWYLGQCYPLALIEDGRTTLLDLDGKRFLLAKKALAKAPRVFDAWYRQQARQVLTDRVGWFADRYDFQYQQLKITSARTRWGSCSARGTLSFTWRLVMAPMPMIDYVVVHELVHLVERNHSKRFWAGVAAILPDYKARLDWFKKNGQLLSL